ncbi:hypothetical protein V2J09_008691 [Rumex salicifolius]
MPPQKSWPDSPPLPQFLPHHPYGFIRSSEEDQTLIRRPSLSLVPTISLRERTVDVPLVPPLRPWGSVQLTGLKKKSITLQWAGKNCSLVEISGLDIGWGESQKLPLTFNKEKGLLIIERELPIPESSAASRAPLSIVSSRQPSHDPLKNQPTTSSLVFLSGDRLYAEQDYGNQKRRAYLRASNILSSMVNRCVPTVR